LTGATAALIRGPSGSGKSRLAFDLINALPFARLIADDRAHVEARNGCLLVRPAKTLEGMIEIRGLGIRHMPFESVAAVGLVVDLAANDASRMSEPSTGQTEIEGVVLPRLAVADGVDALPAVLAFLRTAPAAD
jgi:serine kinase of HPr protein (carbohydrate metabolism regulator)